MCFHNLYGYPTAGDYSEEYFVGGLVNDPDNNKVIVHYPGAAFPSYLHRYEFDKGNVYVSRSSKSFDMSFTPVHHTMNVSMTDDGFTYSTSGDFQFSVAFFYSVDFDTDWSFVMPKGTNKTLVAPKLPNEIKALADIPVFDFPGMGLYTIHQYNDFNTYEAFIDVVRNLAGGVEAVEGLGREFTYMEVYVGNDDEGGRKGHERSGRRSFKDKLTTSVKKKK